MRKIFHFVSAFGASIATYVGIDPLDSLNNENEIFVTSETDNNLDSDNFNFPISESLLNGGENDGDVLVENDINNENSPLLTQKGLEFANSRSDGDIDQNEIEKADDDKDLTKTNVISLSISESDSIDLELSRAALAKLDSAEAAEIEEENNMYKDLEVSGLIMDDTRTKIGRDFYDEFFNNWNAQTHITSYYSIEIIEKAARGSVSQIIVKVNDAEVMRQFVQLRNTEIEEMANKAVYRVRRYLANEREMKNRLLEESDQMGSGLF